MGLMTPVLKGYLTDKGFKICSDAMQVHGGSGFTEHFPASQYLRDVRIALIYEGTNGVQALDLSGVVKSVSLPGCRHAAWLWVTWEAIWKPPRCSCLVMSGYLLSEVWSRSRGHSDCGSTNRDQK